jgi:hypothetical protein
MAKKSAREPVNKGGRPPILVNNEETREKINAIATRLHTQPEAAALLGVSLSCFAKFLHEHEDVRHIWEGGGLTGRAALRRMQFSSAQKGNVQMQIHLGKHYLGQQEKTTVETTGKDGGPIHSVTEIRLTDDDKRAVLDILE